MALRGADPPVQISVTPNTDLNRLDAQASPEAMHVARNTRPASQTTLRGGGLATPRSPHRRGRPAPPPGAWARWVRDSSRRMDPVPARLRVHDTGTRRVAVTRERGIPRWRVHGRPSDGLRLFGEWRLPGSVAGRLGPVSSVLHPSPRRQRPRH